MSSLAQLSLPAAVPTRSYQLLLREVRGETQSIKSLNPQTRTLTTLYWYVVSMMTLVV
jgi:hypothetical protein